METPVTPDPHQMIRELTAPHSLAEAHEHDANGTRWTSRHHVTAPALLDQLSGATPLEAGGAAAGGYKSKPAANTEAIDTLIRIDLQAARWVKDLGHDDEGDTKAVVRLAGSLLPQTTRCTHPAQDRRAGCCLHHDIARWWHQARVVSGWDQPPFKPDNTCPLCGKRGGLRVHRTDLTAHCTECHETWDSETVLLLGEHIKAENGDTLTEGEVLADGPPAPYLSAIGRSVSRPNSPEPQAGALQFPGAVSDG